MSDDDVATYGNGEYLKEMPKELLEKYEKKSIKCNCKETAKLVWSVKRQKCFYVCKKDQKTKCNYIRRFEDVYDGFVEDELMETYA